MKRERLKKVVSVMLSIFMVLSILPTTNIYADEYSEGDIEGTTGTGTNSDPVVCDTFEEFKAAMESVDILCVKLKGCYNCELPDIETYQAAITVIGPLKDGYNTKKLIIDGSSTFYSRTLDGGVYDSLIRVPKGVELCIEGGTLCFSGNGSNGLNAVVRNEGWCEVKNSNISAIKLYANTYGRAIVNLGNGILKIHSGTFAGIASSKYDGPHAAVVCSNNSNTYILGGEYNTTTDETTIPNGYNSIAVSDDANCVIYAGTFKKGINMCDSQAYIGDLLNYDYYCFRDADGNEINSEQYRYDDYMYVGKKTYGIEVDGGYAYYGGYEISEQYYDDRVYLLPNYEEIPEGMELAGWECTSGDVSVYTDSFGNYYFVMPNSDVKIKAVYAGIPVCTASDVEVTGEVGSELTKQSIRLDLTNDTFIWNESTNLDATSWVNNLPDGLSAEVIAIGTNLMRIMFTGTPTETITEPIDITIPGEMLKSGKELSVTENENAIFNITNRYATMNDVSVGGVVGEAISSKTINIHMENESLDTDIMNAIKTKPSNVAYWFKNIPSGLTANVVDYDSQNIQIEITGTPTSECNEPIELYIPQSVTVSEKSLDVIKNENAAFFITPVDIGTTTVTYRTQVQREGWQNWVSDGATSGTVGKALRLEGINVKVENSKGIEGGISYRTHVQKQGWQSYVSDGALSGTVGKSLRLEAIQIKLTGDLEDYFNVYYRVQAEKFGWLGWAKNDEQAGTAGYGYRLEAIQILVKAKNESAPTKVGGVAASSMEPYYSKYDLPVISYKTQVQSYGWEKDYTTNGGTSGTVGKAKRLEGIKIKISNNRGYEGGISYRTHVQKQGWQSYVSDDALSGTVGKALRLEAIQIKLTGEIAEHFDIYYRVQAQKFGWMGWAKNDAQAGTAGYGYRLEAIQIQVVGKGAPSSVIGATANAFRKK